MYRSRSILIKLSTDEKTHIADRAALRGCTISEYVRKCALGESMSPHGKLLQEISHQLCLLADATNQIEDPKIRANFVRLEKELWQIIR